MWLFPVLEPIFFWYDVKLFKRLFIALSFWFAYFRSCMLPVYEVPIFHVSLSQRSSSELDSGPQPLCALSPGERSIGILHLALEVSFFPFWFIIDVFCGYFLFRRTFTKEQMMSHWVLPTFFFFFHDTLWIAYKFKMISLHKAFIKKSILYGQYKVCENWNTHHV